MESEQFRDNNRHSEHDVKDSVVHQRPARSLLHEAYPAPIVLNQEWHEPGSEREESGPERVLAGKKQKGTHQKKDQAGSETERHLRCEAGSNPDRGVGLHYVVLDGHWIG